MKCWSMTSHARVEAACIALGGSGLTWQITKCSQRFKAVLVGRWGMGVWAKSRKECQKCAWGEDLHDNGIGGGTVTSMFLSHRVPMRSCQPGEMSVKMNMSCIEYVLVLQAAPNH